VVCVGDGAQQKGKQKKGKQQKGGGGGGPSGKAAAAGSSSGEASTSRGEASCSRTLPSGGAGLRSTVEDAAQPALPSAEAASGAQQTDPQPAGGGKKEKERQRKERQRQRKIKEAWEALQVAVEAMLAGARCVSPLWFMCIGRLRFLGRWWRLWAAGRAHSRLCGGDCGCSGKSALGALEEATAEAAKHGDRSESLVALVEEARAMLEQARAEQVERARAAAEEAVAAAAVKEAADAEAEAERLQAEEEVAALTLVMQGTSMRLQEARARLGSSVAPPVAPAPYPDAEETLCVVCFDAPKDHAIVPCGHVCVCASCAEQLTTTRTPMCPVCRAPILQTLKLFCS
jgi:hypothetical protein